MTKELFEALADLRIKEREIKNQIDEIYPQILEEVADIEEGTIIASVSGNFTVSHRRTWEYTEEVEKLNKELKDQKKKEEQMGHATYTTKPSVVFKAVR